MQWGQCWIWSEVGCGHMQLVCGLWSLYVMVVRGWAYLAVSSYLDSPCSDTALSSLWGSYPHSSDMDLGSLSMCASLLSHLGSWGLYTLLSLSVSLYSPSCSCSPYFSSPPSIRSE